MKNRHKLHITIDLNDEILLNEETENLILVTDNGQQSTLDFEDSLQKVTELICSLLLKFGLDQTGESEEKFFLDQNNKIRLKSVLYQFLDNTDESLTDCFNEMFMRAGINKYGYYIDLEEFVNQALETLEEKLTKKNKVITESELENLLTQDALNDPEIVSDLSEIHEKLNDLVEKLRNKNEEEDE